MKISRVVFGIALGLAALPSFAAGQSSVTPTTAPAATQPLSKSVGIDIAAAQ